MVKWKRATPDLPLFDTPDMEPEPYAPLGLKLQVRGPGIGIDGIRKQLQERKQQQHHGNTAKSI